jgi:hypothetical protein
MRCYRLYKKNATPWCQLTVTAGNIRISTSSIAAAGRVPEIYDIAVRVFEVILIKPTLLPKAFMFPKLS